MGRESLKRHQALWTFVRHPGVEPTHNTAERGSLLPPCFPHLAVSGNLYSPLHDLPEYVNGYHHVNEYLDDNAKPYRRLGMEAARHAFGDSDHYLGR